MFGPDFFMLVLMLTGWLASYFRTLFEFSDSKKKIRRGLFIIYMKNDQSINKNVNFRFGVNKKWVVFIANTVRFRLYKLSWQ